MAFSGGILTASSRNELMRTSPVCTTGNTTGNDREHTGSGSLVVALVVTAPHPCPLHNDADDIAQIVRGLDVHVLIIKSA